jgi:hypothetical protein
VSSGSTILLLPEENNPGCHSTLTDNVNSLNSSYHSPLIAANADNSNNDYNNVRLPTPSQHQLHASPFATSNGDDIMNSSFGEVFLGAGALYNPNTNMLDEEEDGRLYDETVVMDSSLTLSSVATECEEEEERGTNAATEEGPEDNDNKRCADDSDADDETFGSFLAIFALG